MVAKTKSVSSDCTKNSKAFKGNTVCANACKSSVGALLESEQQEAALLQTEEALRAEVEATAEDEAIAEQDWPSIFGTTEKCCRCKTGTVGWSASGTCSFCQGKKNVAKTKSVSSDCTKNNKKFKGNTVCANACKSTVGALLETEQREAALLQTEEAMRA